MNGRTLAGLFVVVVILGAVVYIMNKNDAGTTADSGTAVPSATPQIKLVKDATIDDVQRLEVTRFEDDFQVAFVREENGDWFQVVPTRRLSALP